MNGRSASVFASISSKSKQNGRGSSHGLNNPTWLLAAVFGACHWASTPCYGQIDVNAYISNFNSDNVSVIDTVTNTLVGSPIAVGSEPNGLTVTPDGQFIYVVNGATAQSRS
jgi:YVTN family beta-propeller protein